MKKIRFGQKFVRKSNMVSCNNSDFHSNYIHRHSKEKSLSLLFFIQADFSFFWQPVRSVSIAEQSFGCLASALQAVTACPLLSWTQYISLTARRLLFQGRCGIIFSISSFLTV